MRDSLNYKMCPEYLRLIKIFVFSGMLDYEVLKALFQAFRNKLYEQVLYNLFLRTNSVQIVLITVLYK